jgi:inner membrane transporter RhtA
MAIAAIVLLPLGVATVGPVLVRHPQVLVVGAGVALLSSVVPYSLEIAALRRMPARVFGVLVSLEPALAALAGWLVLHEQLSVRSLVAIALGTAAAMGAARSGRSGRSGRS